MKTNQILRELIEAENAAPKDLAKKVGNTSQWIKMMQHEIIETKFSVLEKIADELGYNIKIIYEKK